MKIMRNEAAIPAWSVVTAALFALTLWSVTVTWASDPPDPNQKIDETRPDDANTANPLQAPSQVVVRFKVGAELAGFLGTDPVRDVAAMLDHGRTYLLNLAPEADVDSAAAALSQMSSVDYAHPNYLINRLHPVQGSYPFSDVSGTGDYPQQASVSTLHLPEAHTQATGSGVTVGLIDVGVDYDNPTLAGVTVSGHDYVDDDEYAFDEPGGLHSGHGTFVAGVIHLAAPDAQIRAYRIADETGYGDGFSLAQAIELAVDDGCKVINLSVALVKRHLAVRDAIDYAEANGVLVVAAAGNQAKNVAIYPATETAAAAVGAIEATLQLTSFSTYGPQISVCAPGLDVYSTYLDDFFAWWSGTSFSAPFVAGVAALVAESAPEASGIAIRNAIEATATNIDSYNPGLENLLGNGLVDPVAAIAYLEATEVATVTPDTLYFTHQVGRMYFVPPFESAWLQSTNAPANFYAEVLGSPDPLFSFANDTVGNTDDSVTISINPFEVPGVFMNTVLFHVDGVAEPAELIVHCTVEAGDTTAQAWTSPAYLYFQSTLGQESLLFGTVVIQSTNAPANYVAWVLEGGSQVASLPDSTGLTPDSVTIVVDPALAPGAGTFEDTVAILVDGVLNPVPVFVILQVVDTISKPLVVVETIDAMYGTEFGVCVRTEVGAEPWGGFDFLLRYDPSMLTLLDATPAGFMAHCGWEHFSYATPDTGLVRMIGVADLAGVPGEPNCKEPGYGDAIACMNFQAVDDSAPSCRTAPIRFWWQDCGDNAISNELGDVTILAGAEPGSVIDYNGSDITGLANIGGPPRPCPINPPGPESRAQFRNGAVYLGCDTIPIPPDSAWTLPTGGLTLVSDDLDTAYACVFIHSSNAPANYVVEVIDTPSFVWLTDSVGTTNDSVCFLLGASLPPGNYIDTLVFYVDGVTNNPVMQTVQLTVPEAPAPGPSIVVDTVSAATGTGVDVCLRTIMSGGPWGGYDLTLSYDPALLTLVSATAGDFLTGCGWEHFAYSEPGSGLVRLVAVADLAGVPGVPTCNDPGFGDQLACLNFQTVDDSTPTCTAAPIRFWWTDCGDNAFSNTAGDTLIIADVAPGSVLDYSGTDLTGQPDIGGPPRPCSSGPIGPVSTAHFKGGAVFIECDSVVTPTDSAYVAPQILSVTVDVASTDSMARQALLWSANAPATWFGYVLGMPSFASLPDSVGMTNDSVLIMFSPAGLTLGSYYDSVVFEIQDVTDPVLLFVQLHIVHTDSMSQLTTAVHNYPNPFNPSTQIAFALGRSAQVKLEIYNILGARIATLADEYLQPGEHKRIWDGTTSVGRPAASGVYFYRLHIDAEVHTGKMLMVR